MISNGRFKPYHSIYITSSRRQTAKLQFTAAKANIGGYGVIYNLTAKQQLIYQ